VSSFILEEKVLKSGDLGGSWRVSVKPHSSVKEISEMGK
jgi:hypothetical protein